MQEGQMGGCDKSNFAKFEFNSKRFVKLICDDAVTCRCIYISLNNFCKSLAVLSIPICRWTVSLPVLHPGKGLMHGSYFHCCCLCRDCIISPSYQVSKPPGAYMGVSLRIIAYRR